MKTEYDFERKHSFYIGVLIKEDTGGVRQGVGIILKDDAFHHYSFPTYRKEYNVVLMKKNERMIY